MVLAEGSWSPEILFCVFSSCPVDVQKELRIAVWLGCSEVRSRCGVENRESMWKRYLGQQEEESRSHLRISVAHGWCQLQLQLGRNVKTGGKRKGSKLHWHANRA